MSDTIINNESITTMSDKELEQLYNNTKTWKEFFETIYNKIKISKFCIFIAPWIDDFILKYFNTLQGLKYALPIKDYNIQYNESEYKRGSRRFTRKATPKSQRRYVQLFNSR
jgi:hypothetical protein